jgi:adenylate cyclase
VVGDSVNLASRLEGLNKFYGTTVIVSASTHERVKDLFPFRELDEVQVKGRKETLRIYELLVDPAFDPKRFLPLFAEGLKVYREGLFTKAKTIFEECLAITPKDGPSRLFLERCQKMEEAPPEGWQGVTTFLRK